MNTLTAFQFDEKEVRFVDGLPVANDVAIALGYASPAKTISTKVDPENKGVAKIQTLGGVQSIVVLKETGVIQLVSGCRLPNGIDLARSMGLTVFNTLPEQESIRVLKSAFADLIPVCQFAVYGYRIDLYLAKANIAIECDERGHTDLRYKKDKEREEKIKAALGCSFVRYNPDADDFNIGEVIFEIRGLI